MGARVGRLRAGWVPGIFVAGRPGALLFWFFGGLGYGVWL